jgi:hypothetical protein
MNAPQDAWAKPLSKRMIDKYRSQSLTYIKVTSGAYNETLGTVAITEARFTAAGAVTRSKKSERNGVGQGNEVSVWVDHDTVPWPISSNDRLEYLGRKWKVTEVESYGSGIDGVIVGPIYLTTLDGKMITTLGGKAIVIQGSEDERPTFAMYASKITARAE